MQNIRVNKETTVLVSNFSKAAGYKFNTDNSV